MAGAQDSPSETGPLARCGRAIAAVERVCANLGAVVVFAIMAIVALDVLLRYLFNAPLSWSFDLISLYLMVAVFYLALSDALQSNHHVAVDILRQHLPRRFWRGAQAACLALIVPLFLVIAWLAAGRALEKLRHGDVVAGAIAWPTWPPAALVALGAALIALRLVFRVVALALAVAQDGAAVIGTPEPRDPTDAAAEV